jgi:uncharacterized membrane protein
VTQLPLHPALVHLPIGIAFLLPFLALGIAAAMWRSWLPKNAWLIVCLTSGFGVATGFLAGHEGEEDEHQIMRVSPGALDKLAIHEHEEAADVFVYSLLGLTVAAIAVFFAVKPEGTFKIVALVISALFFVPVFLAIRAGERGGKLVYELGAGSVKR